MSIELLGLAGAGYALVTRDKREGVQGPGKEKLDRAYQQIATAGEHRRNREATRNANRAARRGQIYP